MIFFRRTDKYGYSRYYGGGGPAWIIKIIVTILVLVLLVLGGIVFAMQKYMVYTANGGHLEFPWSKDPGTSDNTNGSLTSSDLLNNKDEGGDTSNGDKSDPDNVIVDDGKKDPGDQGDTSAGGQGQEEQTDKKPPLSGDILVQHVSIGDVTSGHAEGDLKNVNANGIMLYLKESSGKLNYASDLELSGTFKTAGNQSTSDSISSTIDQLNGNDYYTLAYVNCFQDQAAGTSDSYSLYDTGNASWYDGEGVAWANPANEDMQDYIVDIVKDLVAMGYDEIVLNNAGYPTSGNTDILNEECYDPDTLADTVNGFYAKLSEAVKNSDTILSVITTPTAITEGTDPASGQSLENMLQLGGRLWVQGDNVDDPAALAEALSKAGYPDNALGLLVGSLDQESGYCQMNLD